ncbi:hypothetical protein TRSC58_01486 [Trypanosoma rangeli SC58]|uniref:Uncharacterized protein n=1 Tax=Trypanosoma rangeli SC58 TaxID=429131 RepID=A0A061J8W5_TRYRA|nr:hypothetical protein TRSC58_01486 [Trypanosoma rangeli SC58]
MSTVVIKAPNLRKLLAEQQELLPALPHPPSPIATYLAAPVLPLTSVYHSRGGVECIEDRSARQCGDEEGDVTTERQPSLLTDILGAASRVSLDVEKTLDLAYQVLSKARRRLPDLSDNARESLGRIVELGVCFNALPPPEPTATPPPEN